MKRMFVLLSCFCALAVLIGRVNAQETPEAEKPITIDFVRNDIRVVMHYIGLRAGLNITVEGDIAEEITYMPAGMTLADTWDILRRDYGLEVVVTGTHVYIKKGKQDSNEDPWYRAQRRMFQAQPNLPVMPRRSKTEDSF